jgi:integrase
MQKDPRNGNYFIRLQVGGTRKYFNLGRTMREARRELTRLKKDIAHGNLRLRAGKDDPSGAGGQGDPAATPGTRHPTPGDPFLSELIAAHLKWVRVNRAIGTFKNCRMYEEHFLSFVGDRPVSTITRMMLEDFFSWARKNHSKSRNGGIIFVRHIKTMFLWAEEMDICSCPIRKFPTVAERPPDTKRFSDEELEKLLSCVSGECEDFRDMIVFGLHTGLRPKELRELKRSQLHHDGNGNYAVFIQHHKTARCAHEPKPRSVPLTPEAKEIALRHLAAHADSEWIFLNATGGVYTKNVFRQRLRRWCQRAGIKPRPPYALRHTFGSMEAEANVNQTVIAQMMGHSQIRTTARYISNNAEHHRVAVGAVGSRIAKLAVAEVLA